MGPTIEARLVRHGFYPAGGGRTEVDIAPVPALSRLDLLARGALQSVEARAIVAALPGEIAVRELEAVAKILGWPEERRRIEQPPERAGPGNILMLEAAFEHVTELMSGFGKLGVPAQTVGEQAAKRMAGYLASDAVAGPYLADQLLLPMALAGGGSFTTVKPSMHARTCAEVIARFLPVTVTFEEQSEGHHLVTVAAR
jgi:RNA 3'-terminal phosphate cyclase (ATP)